VPADYFARLDAKLNPPGRRGVVDAPTAYEHPRGWPTSPGKQLS